MPSCLWGFPVVSLHPAIVRNSLTKAPAAIWHSMACMPRCIGCTLRTVPDLGTSKPAHQQFLRTDLSYRVQVVAGLRCCISKTAFLLGMLMGKRWAPEELFTSEAGARPEASHILSTMSLHLQRSSNVARRSCHCSADSSPCLHMLACSPHVSQPVHHEPPPAEEQQCGLQVWPTSCHCHTTSLPCLPMLACPSHISQPPCTQGCWAVVAELEF